MVEDKLGTRFGRGSAASLGTRPRDTVAIGQLIEKIICAALYFPQNLPTSIECRMTVTTVMLIHLESIVHDNCSISIPKLPNEKENAEQQTKPSLEK